MLTINGSVGKGALNADADVANVVALLKARKRQAALKTAMQTIDIFVSGRNTIIWEADSHRFG